MDTEDTTTDVTGQYVPRQASPGRRPAVGRRYREPDSTERGLRIAIVMVAIGMTLAAGFMLYKAIADREAPPHTYWQYQMRLWQNTVRQTPESPVGYENLGYIYYKMGRYRQAINTLKQSLALDPQRIMSMINLGRVYRDIGQEDLAVKYMIRGATLATPSNKAVPYFEVGEIYAKQGKTEKAVESFKSSLADDPTMYDTHISLGGLYEKQGKSDLALVEYYQAIRFVPSDFKTEKKVKALATKVYSLAESAAAAGRTDEAMNYYKALRAGAPIGSKAKALLQLGIYYIGQKNLAQAQAELTAASKDGGNPDPAVMQQVHTKLAETYAAQGNKAEAAKHRAEAAKF